MGLEVIVKEGNVGFIIVLGGGGGGRSRDIGKRNVGVRHLRLSLLPVAELLS